MRLDSFDGTAHEWLSIPLPIDDATIETVARGICEIGYIDGAFCMVHESYDEIADGYCTTGHWMAKNGLTALAEAVA